MTAQISIKQPACLAKPSYRLERDLPATGAVGELRQLPQWVAWNYEWDTDRASWAKRPKNPHTGYGASVSDPFTWSNYEAARQCQIDRQFSGVGFVLTADDGLTGGDLDHCYQVAGETTDWAREVINLGETYFEVSPSGKGVRFIARGKIDATTKHDAANVELYAKGRFLTITGDHVAGTPDAINPAPEAIASLLRRVAAFRAAKDQNKVGAGGPRSNIAVDIGGGDSFFRRVNAAALFDLSGWVPKLFTQAIHQPGTDGWRVTSRHLSRDLEEDLSFHPSGITDFGEERGMTAIDVLMHHLGAPNALEAALCLCETMGIDPASLGYSKTPARHATSDGNPRPNSGPDFDLSHDALASDMGAQGWDRDARHVALWGKWLFWTGTRWLRDERLDHMTRTRAYLRARAESLTEWAEAKAAQIEADEAEGKGEKLRTWAKDQARSLRHKNTIAAIESLARSNAALVASARDFDRDRLLLGTPGGTVDLRTGLLRAARRDDMLTMQTAVAPAPGSPVLWLKFLNEVFGGDADLIAFMQRAAGYALTGETREHKLLFLYGTGRNGKSVFLNTLFGIWGDYARRAHSATFLNSVGDKHPTDLAGLQGARLVAGSELPKDKTWDESTIKDLTGGDTMTARFMRGDFFDFDPQLTLFVAGNNMPSFRGVDEAIRARVVLVPFTVTIPPERRDTHLADKLQAEAGQILQWAIEGAQQWQARGLDVPASVAAASAEYFDDEDTLGQFLADEIRAESTAFVTTTALHQRFVQWCQAQGLNAWTLRTLQKEVKGRGWIETRKNHGRGFMGMQLK